MKKIKEALEKNGKYWIAFVGDSITSTEWVHPNWREIVEYVLKDKLQNEFSDWRVPSWGIRCFNWGFDGSTTSDILNKLGDIKSVNPNLVIVMMGLNDPTLGVSLETHMGNIKKLISEFGDKSLVISTDIYPNSEQEQNEYLSYVQADAKTDYKKAKFINLFEEFKLLDPNKLFTFKLEDGSPDTLHPNQLGNAYIAKVILKQVFGIDFDPEKYIETTAKGYKYPEY